ncbi:rhamnulose-1-phosphate aldolase [Anaerococcus sp. AGMB00486]|uniref:Rhamnulose-1-phosphate aldolase n=2 Tax=Anaerococcus TaxID=165779 RepID=A0ABX2NBW1_9FIRM|nr:MULTISPECIES: rhamnulose-1-phosphate aldolase [Anaerococcus]MDY3005826.1 rhamnulose-1-phosphate aldolase [Anaerococcus porci]MSS78681.1 rhamnulose-1-phosphate aldolase [Anaerococcus porci]NVF12182.1 rhamnulose-1-phosphate aldolase [Anaerococcus faecalis]
MKNNFIESEPVRGIADITYDMWKRGWDEYNGGNVSYLLSDYEVSKIKLDKSLERNVEIPNMPDNLVGRYILITASGSHFRTLKDNLRTDIGVVKITEKGYTIVWGFEENNKPTSEFYLHTLSHSSRLEIDPNHKVILHNHATNIVKLGLVLEATDKAYTLPLWRVLTEGVYVFNDGIGVVPWQLPGTESIGSATAKKLKTSRIVVWDSHGVMASGKSYQDCFGLIETVNKAAGIYLDTLTIRKTEGLSDQQIKDFAESLGLKAREDIFN